MKMISLILYLFVLSLLFPPSAKAASQSVVGVTYSSPDSATIASSGQLTPGRIASHVNSIGIRAVRILDSDPALVRAFAYTNTSLLLTISNALIPPLAANRSLALRWVYRHVLPYHPRTKISLISVGDDAISSSPDISSYLLPAIRNVYLSLRDLSINKISISTTFSFFSIITTAFPPSSAQFQQPAGDLIIRPLLQFLDDTNSSFLVNIYPYNMYRANSEIPIGFTLFQENPFNYRDDMTTGVRYRNLFDMMVDAVISSMAVMGHENVPLVVAETGWPSSGADPGEVDATPLYAEMFLKGLIQHLQSGLGTPLRKEGVAETYIYELVDRDLRQGSRNWGILNQNMTKKYKLQFSGMCSVHKKRINMTQIFLAVLMILWMF